MMQVENGKRRKYLAKERVKDGAGALQSGNRRSGIEDAVGCRLGRNPDHRTLYSSVAPTAPGAKAFP